MITIDEIELPMQSINHMPKSNHKALALTNSLASCKEPKSMEEATNRVVRILDANYKKANLKEVVDTCTHLSPEGSCSQSMSLSLMGLWVLGKPPLSTLNSKKELDHIMVGRSQFQRFTRKPL